MQHIRFEPQDDQASPPPATTPAGPARLAALEAENRALRGELAELRRILGSATDHAIVTLDPGGRVASWNPGAQAILGYGADEIVGRPAEAFFTPEDRADGAFTRELCLALEQGRAVNERWHLRRDGSRFWASGVMLPLLDEGGGLHGFLNIFRDGTEMRQQATRAALVEAELLHRLRNILSLASVVAVQSQREAESPEAFQQAFESRIRALARSQQMLAEGGWDGAPLRTVIGRALAPYGDEGTRVALDGLPLRLAAPAVVSLGLAFHELATNAAKHGALSVPGGRVSVQWTRRPAAGGAAVLEIVWREAGGPPVAPPRRQGFGSRLLEQSLPYEFDCTVTRDFAPAGLECRIRLPLTARVLGLDAA